MRPRADEVLDSVIWTYDLHILAAVQEGLPKSLALTISNLLRHVRLRMEHEGPVLVADNAELRELLGEIDRYVAGLSPCPDTLDGLREALAQSARPTANAGYVGLVMLSEEAQALRGVLDQALQALQQGREALGMSADYQALRKRIRTYLVRQLERESVWIKDAFTIARR